MAKHESEREEREEREHRRHGGETKAEEREEREHKEHEHRARGGELHTRMEMDRPEDKAGGHVRRHRRARGGKSESPVHVYNAEGSPEIKEVEDEREDFSHGGRKRKHGGHAEGEHMPHRADKTPRGRRKHGGEAREHEEHERRRHGGEAREHERHRRAAGGSVWSSGKAMSMKEGEGDSRGHEGVKVPNEPD